jgi:hypothetical protein
LQKAEETYNASEEKLKQNISFIPTQSDFAVKRNEKNNAKFPKKCEY